MSDICLKGPSPGNLFLMLFFDKQWLTRNKPLGFMVSEELLTKFRAKCSSALE